MVSAELRKFVVYPVRFILYIAHSIILTTVMAMGLFFISLLSITLLGYFNLIDISYLYAIPILGMATYLAQHQIARLDKDNQEPEYENFAEKLTVESFIVIYYNFLFLLSVCLTVVLAVGLESLGWTVAIMDAYLIVGFSYPILDILMFTRLRMSLAALPVALFVSALHQIGKVTWVSAQNLDIEHVPIVDLFLRTESPR